jgi:hypothetical protein
MPHTCSPPGRNVVNFAGSLTATGEVAQRKFGPVPVLQTGGSVVDVPT